MFIQLLLGSINTVLEKVKVTVLCSIVDDTMETEPAVERKSKNLFLLNSV